MRLFKKSYVTKTFWLAIGLTLVVVLAALLVPGPFEQASQWLRNRISTNFAWYYLLLSTMIVLVCLYTIVSPIGKIRLGAPHSKPDYSTFSWLAMLFSAGMGIGLVFYGAAEPLSHFAISAPEASLGSQQAMADSLKYSIFHYGIHAWAIYAIVGLALAYFQFRKRETTLLSVVLKPLFKDHLEGWIAHLIDALTIFATVVGVATTLGFGAAQINSGLHAVLGVPESLSIQITIIVVATILFLLSAVSGIGKGVRILSNLNVLVAALLMLGVFLLGPRVEILNRTISALGAYGQDFMRLSLHVFNQHFDWQKAWTILYWSWWISWSPFVGVFIARISKGRTIREFLTFVILIPTLFSALWFGVFGVLSMKAVQVDPSIASLSLENILFGVLRQLPMFPLLSGLVIVLVFSFFVTSADSATFVLSMQSEDGRLNPSNRTKILWGILVSSIAGVLLINGGLNALQNVLVIVAFPFSILLLLVVIATLKEMEYERKEMGLTIKPEKYPTKEEPFRSYDD